MRTFSAVLASAALLSVFAPGRAEAATYTYSTKITCDRQQGGAFGAVGKDHRVTWESFSIVKPAGSQAPTRHEIYLAAEAREDQRELYLEALGGKWTCVQSSYTDG